MSGARVHVDHGTREVLGRVLLMDRDQLLPGESTLAQVRLEEPLMPRYDDRFIVRSYSPVYTIGGGVVLDALPPRRTNLRPHERELLEALLGHDLGSASVGLLDLCTQIGVPGHLYIDAAERLRKAGLAISGETGQADAVPYYVRAVIRMVDVLTSDFLE